MYTSTHIVISALNNLDEQCRSILNVSGENLKEVPVLVEVDENLELLKNGNVLDDLRGTSGETLTKHVVISVGNVEELETAGTEIINGFDYVVSIERDMLYSSTTVILNEFLYL